MITVQIVAVMGVVFKYIEGLTVKNLNVAKQIMLVITDDWNTVGANMYCFDIDECGNYQDRLSMIPVVIGKNGLAWSDEKFQLLEPQIATKTEGDSKAPAGIFTLGKMFGFAAEINKSYTDYVQINNCVECIDDIKSKHYNHIVDSQNISHDWSSSEKMSTINIYKYGIEVLHNRTPTKHGNGSCIFMHIWKGEDIGTEGCTAMSESNMIDVLKWLDYNKNPVLVQLPKNIYKQVQQEWKLPKVRELYE